jgi:hypothetical protein
MDIIFLILATTVLVGVGYIIYELALYARQFKYDKNNPHRRVCRECGQVQNEFADCPTCKPSWWKDVGTIKDPDCNCHNYSWNDN